MHVRPGRSAVVSIVLALGAVTTPAVAATAASAAPRVAIPASSVLHPGTGCYGSSCTGQDPVAEGCSSTVSTIDSVSGGTFTVNLRYSSACNAVWAQAVGVSSSQYAGEVLGYTNPSDMYPVVGYITGTPSAQGSYSRMVSFTYWTQSCVAYFASGWETHNCTRLH